ncbi:MAG: mitochondrial import inner membrane translocase subunit tim54 [Ramalina farinacea]|uniref:Mitochondrial import inner membrane translocase subunit TIM54 n=1 Tax=Ramalina farinacea TaxID=258253 RepID=A0AA43QQK0_9LECA|nr:mitochondrial import inner membrane translocase subunit tim54 [Ramalina farinacea]
MGLPRLSRLKLPSRNWLIFIGVVGSWTSALLYDRYHKKRAQRKWCELVSHIREETIPSNMMPRRITILLAAPPGDGLRVAREHFHEYVKPILVAGAMDWEVIEGRKEGEVRAGLAEKIRMMRRREGEVAVIEEGDDDEKFEREESVRALRGAMGIREWEGVRGDLVLGRHTWKEYVTGLHEGWLGPIDAPKPVEEEVPLQEISVTDPIPTTRQPPTQPPH